MRNEVVGLRGYVSVFHQSEDDGLSLSLRVINKSGFHLVLTNRTYSCPHICKAKNHRQRPIVHHRIQNVESSY